MSDAAALAVLSKTHRWAKEADLGSDPFYHYSDRLDQTLSKSTDVIRRQDAGAILQSLRLSGAQTDPYFVYGDLILGFVSAQGGPIGARSQRLMELPSEAPDPLELLKEVTEQRFHALAAEWQTETGHYSILARRYAHPAYKKILDMGEGAVPLILHELAKRPDRWFEALSALTYENPARDAATFDEGVRAWLAWGKNRGILS